MSDPINAPIAAITESITRKASEVVDRKITGAIEALSGATAEFTKSFVNNTKVAFRLGFKDFLESTYKRCSTYKTIVNPMESLDLIDNYVNIELDSPRKLRITDSTLIDSIDREKFTIVTGLAGSGKSILMKYITICRLEVKGETIPLYVELRDINKLVDPNLLSFIRSVTTTVNSKVTEEQFLIGLKWGIFTLILDGFDEINYETREKVHEQIINLSRNYPKTSIIVSSRPDDRFNSWPQFRIYKIRSLELPQISKLVRLLPYDNGVKMRFLQRVRSDLFKSHRSFLSCPLLVAMMLLTFEEYAEVPEKMHIFYGQAFDTLFQKHDAQKDQFQRQIRTKLSRGDFRACFSVLCFLTYAQYKFSFTEDHLIEFAKHAIDYMNHSKSDVFSKISPEDFVLDLREAVCMLQVDGIKLTFVHRSFQEYFSALFAVNIHSDNIKDVVDALINRSYDTAISMAFDINPNVMEKYWVLPTIDQLFKDLDLENKNRMTSSEKIRKIINKVYIRVDADMAVQAAGAELADDLSHARLQIIHNIYKSNVGFPDLMKNFTEKYISSRISQILLENNKTKPGYDVFVKYYASTDPGIRRKLPDKWAELELTKESDWWIDVLYPQKYFQRYKVELDRVRHDIIQRANNRKDILQIINKLAPRSETDDEDEA